MVNQLNANVPVDDHGMEKGVIVSGSYYALVYLTNDRNS